MSEINDIVELTEGIFSAEIADQYQRKDPILKAKYNTCTLKTGSLCRGSNIKF